jgi:hypothetical protein
MKTKNVLILCEGNLERDPRVLKQILSFKDTANVYTAGDTASGLEDFFFDLHPPVTDIKDTFFTKLTRILPYFFNYMDYYTWRGEVMRQVVYNIKAKNIHFDLIIGNELRPLPIAFAVASKTTKIHFDAHEFYLNDTMPNTVNEMYHRYDKHLLMNYAKKVHTMSTVCTTIANEYEKMLGKKTIVLENVPMYVEQNPTIIDASDIKIIYHGIAMKNRSIDKIIKAFEILPSNYTLYLALVPFNFEKDTYQEIINLINKNSKIILLQPFEMHDISKEINKYDISLCFFEQTTKSVEYALPNKFFEGIQGRLCMAVSPNYEMKKIVEQHSLGVVAKNYTIETIFEEIKKLTPQQILAYKQNSNAVAKKYSFEIIKSTYEQLLH